MQLSIGPDPVDIVEASGSKSSGESGVAVGCTSESVTLANFPVAAPGYMQLDTTLFSGYIEVSSKAWLFQYQSVH